MNLTSQIKGNVDMLILRVVQENGPLYGLEILREIESTTKGEIKMNIGGLYTALHRLVFSEALEADPQPSPRGGAPVSYYTITPKGEALLIKKRSEFDKFQSLVGAFFQKFQRI